eukprot:16389269-Heterocapsa_arctica.AAC.1
MQLMAHGSCAGRVATLPCHGYPKKIIVRPPDLKSNEYQSLFGDDHYEPDEEIPTFGFRACGRYKDPSSR